MESLIAVVTGFQTGPPPHSLAVTIPKLATRLVHVGPGSRFRVSVDDRGRLILEPMPKLTVGDKSSR